MTISRRHTGILRGMFDRLIHKWLRVPYTLNTTVRPSAQKPVATVVFIHGIGNSSKVWKRVIDRLPDDIRVVTVDLLGFGASPHPDWVTYNAHTQARSVIHTLLQLRLVGRVILVGHSLGALVAVEVATRYPLLVRSLILCSPPFYSRTTSGIIPGDKILLRLYSLIQSRPEEFVRISALAMKYNLINEGFNVTDRNVTTYMKTLETSIMNQTSLDDALRIGKPMTVLYGLLDPVVIKRNLKQLSAGNPHARLVTIKTAGHEVKGRFIDVLIQEITTHTDMRGKSADTLPD